MSNTPDIEFVYPDWDAPPVVRAVTTCRRGGFSRAPWDTLNLAAHVDDDPADVARNRARLGQVLGLASAPLWLSQVHGCRVAGPGEQARDARADARYSDVPGEVCAVLTADCLPVVMCNAAGTRVAAAHAGWRGLAGGVLEQTLARFPEPAAELLAWLGPAIGPGAFEVGDEVREVFVGHHAENALAFRAGRPGHWFADLYALARNALRRAGVRRVSGGGLCTFSDAGRFFSYRRDGRTGRMGTLIWIQP